MKSLTCTGFFSSGKKERAPEDTVPNSVVALGRPVVPHPVTTHISDVNNAPWMTFQELLLSTDSFGAGTYLGKGSFGSVFKGLSARGEIWAVKRGDAAIKIIGDFRQKVQMGIDYCPALLICLLCFERPFPGDGTVGTFPS